MSHSIPVDTTASIKAIIMIQNRGDLKGRLENKAVIVDFLIVIRLRATREQSMIKESMAYQYRRRRI